MAATMAAPVVTSGTQSVDSHSQFVSTSSGGSNTVVKAEVGCMTATVNGTNSNSSTSSSVNFLGNCVSSNGSNNEQGESNHIMTMMSNGQIAGGGIIGGGGGMSNNTTNATILLGSISTASSSTSTSTSPPPPMMMMGGFEVNVSPFLNGNGSTISSSSPPICGNTVNGTIASTGVGVGMQTQQQQQQQQESQMSGNASVTPLQLVSRCFCV
jgi:hypothetical protein